MRNSIIYLLIALIAGVLSSCSKDDGSTDNEAPEVNTLTINESDEDIVVSAGSEAHIDISFSDDVELSEARLDMHSNFDGHSHGKLSEPFVWEQIIDLTGKKEYTDHFHIDIPSDATAGFYHFDAIVTDVAGNESDYVSLDIVVESANQATIDLIQPSSDEVDLAPNDNFVIEATITDNSGAGFEEIEIYLEEEHDHDHGKTGEEEIILLEMDLSAESSPYTLNKTLTIPSDIELGHYELVIKVVDQDENSSYKILEAHIE